MTLPPVLKLVKRGFLWASEQTGFSSLVLESSWRRQRLLILGYHGISLSDEHHWDPSLYMHPDTLRQRLELLRKKHCSVLPLREAVQRLQTGTLPEKSVAITFDDGFYDFYRLAHPILQEFGFPVTLFLSTYYSSFNRPVFDSMASYLLWLGRGHILKFPDLSPGPLLLNNSGRDHAKRRLMAFAREGALSGKDKDALLGELARRLGIDYELLCSKRVLHLINHQEASELARNGVDLQLHTHRHRVSKNRKRFLQEIDQNRQNIIAISGKNPSCLCYPGGVHRSEFLPWLREANVDVATTTKPGLATRNSEPLLLPRLLDTSLSATEFNAWLSGVASFFPRHLHVLSEDQFLQEPTLEPALLVQPVEAAALHGVPSENGQ